jgi:hypothetical protein
MHGTIIAEEIMPRIAVKHKPEKILFIWAK